MNLKYNIHYKLPAKKAAEGIPVWGAVCIGLLFCFILHLTICNPKMHF